ncbi:hypothetical protein FACS1894191_5030 [Clostridia bacterium]|nr:hypothetical protein FACS1894191_5030 [Clostridia bacterium]
MFHRMISAARDRWYGSDACTVTALVDYITSTGKMRDAQVEAVKTYLFLKIGCENKSLAALFAQGAFNSLNLSDAELSGSARASIANNPAAAALLEYALLKNDAGRQVSENLERQIKKQPESIDYSKFFHDVFYEVKYTDYLFSLPMGAGKTYLMAAFIYLDLYFALNEPGNKAFAHNFIIFAPSGLKSSVVPSLKTIQKFDPSWIIPEPSASDIKRKMLFEVLDQGKTASKSNKTKNPNVQKIANHQPLSELFGLVAVTNAEKVILDRIKEDYGQLLLGDESEDDKDRQANELRNLIGKLPSLSIFIDEVHHAVSDEIKLRAVVNEWSENNTVNSVIGFSGTPYLEKAEKRDVTDTLSVASAEISNIVYYYPLIDGVGNFLKRPSVKISDMADSAQIIDSGVREFLDSYRDTVYSGGLPAKLGIYCGSIEKLEQTVFPLVSRIIAEYGLSPDTILKFHRGNREYPQPADSQLQFDILDSALSKIRVILLVQIGKEGWDCRSLTGIILSQEGDCPKNMVLQTSCRCLRQVERDMPETALIYLNDSNAKKLNDQLRQQHHISLQEFQSHDNSKTILKRYDRTEYLKLPPVRFYQLAVRYDTQITEAAKPTEAIPTATEHAKITYTVKTQDFSRTVTNISFDESERGDEPATYTAWLYSIAKSSFGFIGMAALTEQTAVLRAVFDTITFERSGSRYYSSRYDRALLEANIRKAFYEKRAFTTKEYLIPEEASLRNTASFTGVVSTDSPTNYFPAQEVVENIILDDNGKLKIDAKTQATIDTLEAAGLHGDAENIRKRHTSHPARNRSFHYLPYKTDSGFEQIFLQEVLALSDVERLGLEVYYNGDRALTEFKIRCYKSNSGRWQYIGMYTPAFLIIKRKDGEIHKAVIVETKGKLYANDPNFIHKRKFMETRFIEQNNKEFGYNRFEYLYLEDTVPEKRRITQTHDAIKSFFEEAPINA